MNLISIACIVLLNCVLGHSVSAKVSESFRTRVEYICNGKTYEKIQIHSESHNSLCNKVLIHTPKGRTIELPNNPAFLNTITEVTSFHENFVTAHRLDRDGQGPRFLVDLYGINKIYNISEGIFQWSPNRSRFFIFEVDDENGCEILSVFSVEKENLRYELQLTSKICRWKCESLQCLINVSDKKLNDLKWSNDLQLSASLCESKAFEVQKNCKKVSFIKDTKTGWILPFSTQTKIAD